MTLDDAIKHCYKKAEELREQDGCLECAHEHEELAGWLEELKKRRENDRPKGKWIKLPRYEGDTQPDFKCDNCGYEITYFSEDNFCAKCGADMRGGADND